MGKIEKYMKQALKNKVKITKALMIAFLINGGFSLAENNPITPGTNLGGENATAIGAGSVSAGSESSSIGTNTFASGNNMTKEEYLKFLKDNKERLSKIELKMQEIKNDKDEIQKLRQEHDDIINKIDRINNYRKTIEDKEKELNEKEPQILKTIEEKRTEAVKFTKEIEDLEKRIDIISQLDFSKINEENKAQGVEILAKDLKQKMEEGQTWLKQYGENGIPLDEYKNAVLSYIDGEKKENIENKMLEILQNYNKGKQNTNFNVVDVIDGFRTQNHLFEYVKVELSFNIPPIFSIFNFLHHFKNIGIQEDGKLYFNNNDEFLEVTKDNMIKYAYNTDLSDFFYHNGLNIEPELFETERQELINWYKKTNKGYANPFNVNIKNFKEYYDIITNETLPIPDRYNSETVKTARQYLKETKELYDNIYKIQESKTTDDFELLKLKKYKSELNKINEKYTTNKKDKIMPIIQVIYDKIQGVSTFNSKSINISDIYSEKYIEDLIKKTRSEFPKKIANSDELLKLWEKYNQKVPNSNLTKVYQDEIDRLKGLEKDANTFITEKEELIKGYKNDIENLKSLLNSENPSDVEEVNKQIQEKEEKIKKALSDIENLKKNLTEIKPGTNALAYGTNSAALGKDSIAFGTNNIAINESSIAFGTNNFVNGNKSIALGYGHKVIGENSISFGVDLLTLGKNNTNIGQLSQVNGEKNQVVGFSNEVKGDQNLVVGNNNRAISNGQVSSIAKVTFIDRNNKDHIIYVPKHTALKEVPNPSLPDKGYFFKDWNLDRNGTGTSVTKDTIVDDDMIVYQIDDKLPPLIIDGGEFNVNMDRSSRVRTRRSAFSTPHPDITLIPRRSPDTNPSESTPKAMTPVVNENVLQGNRNEVFGNGNIVFGSENKVGTETKGVMNNILFGNKIDATNVNNAIVFGNESKPIEGAVSFGNDTTTRQLKFVSKGTDDTDAVNFSQLKDYVKKNAKGKTVNIKNELLSKLNYDPDTYLKIDETYLQYISGKKESPKIPAEKKLSLNINAISDALGKDSDISNPKDKFVTDTKVHDYVATNFVSKNDLDVTKLLKPEDVDVTGDEYITVTPNKNKYALSLNKDKLASNLDLSNNNTITNINTELNKKANLDASNIKDTYLTNWQSVLGNGAITDGNKGLVNGGVVKTYVDDQIKNNLGTINTSLSSKLSDITIKGDKYINTNKVNSSNYEISLNEDELNNHLNSYDFKNNTTIQNINSNIDSIDNLKANKDASNIDPTTWITALGLGNVNPTDQRFVTGAVIHNFVTGTLDETVKKIDTKLDKKLDKDGLDIKGDSKYITVTPSEDKTKKIYTVSFDDAKLTNTINDSNFTNNKSIQDMLGKKADLDGTNLKNINLSAWQSTLGTGKVATGDTGLVTGDTVFSYINPIDTKVNQLSTSLNDKLSNITINGDEYIKTEKTSNSSYNLSLNKNSLETLINSKTADLAKNDAITNINKELDKKANKDASNLEDKDVTNWQEKLGNGSVIEGDTKLVKGGTVFTYVDNIKQQLSTKASQDLAKKLDIDAKNITDDGVATLTTKLGTGEIKDNNNNLVTGGTVKKYITEEINNINTKVSGKLSSSDVDVKGDEYITVNTVLNKPNHYKLAFNKEQLATDLDLSKNTKLNEKFGKYALLDGSNLESNEFNLNVWQAKLGNGTITKDNTGLVKGGDIFTYVNNIKQELNNQATQDLSNKLDKDGSNLDKPTLDKLTNKLSEGSNLTTPTNRLVTDTTVSEALKGKLDVDADNLSDKGVTNLTTKLGTGVVTENNTGLITGGKVYEVKKELNKSISTNTQKITELDNKYTTLNNQVTTNTNDISNLKTDVEDLKNTKQDITNINNKLGDIDKSITNINTTLDGKLDKADLSIKGDKYIGVKKDNKFNYTLSFNKTNLEKDLDLTNNSSINNMFTTKLGDINTNIGDLTTKVESNTNNINSLTNKVDTNTKDIDTLKQDMTKKLNVDADNLTTKGETNLINKLSKGSNISKPNNRLVTDTQVNTFLNDKFKNFNANINDKVINTLQQGVTVVNNKADLALAKSDLALNGISNAVAMANLPQVASYGKYKHMLTAAYGNYAGVNALALGLSGTTDSRRITYKISGSVNTKGNIAFGTGIGVMLGEIHDGNVDTPSHVKEQLIKSEKERQLMRTALINQQNKAKQQEDQIKDLYRIIGELQNQLKNNEKTKESIEKH